MAIEEQAKFVDPITFKRQEDGSVMVYIPISFSGEVKALIRLIAPEEWDEIVAALWLPDQAVKFPVQFYTEEGGERVPVSPGVKKGLLLREEFYREYPQGGERARAALRAYADWMFAPFTIRQVVGGLVDAHVGLAEAGGGGDDRGGSSVGDRVRADAGGGFVDRAPAEEDQEG